MEDAKNVKIKQPIKPNTVVENLTIPDFMKHLSECISRGKDRGKSMGILHNAIKQVSISDVDYSMLIEFKDGKKFQLEATA